MNFLSISLIGNKISSWENMGYKQDVCVLCRQLKKLGKTLHSNYFCKFEIFSNSVNLGFYEFKHLTLKYIKEVKFKIK